MVEEQERVSSLVATWLSSDVGGARVRGGLLDPTYARLGAELQAATKDVPRLIDTNSPKAIGVALVESWGAGAENFGRSGAPYPEPKGRLENVERPTALAEAVAKGSPDAQAMAQLLSAGSRLQEFADGAGFELYALVELRQSSSGALESAQLLRPSGLAPFDAWVLERSRHVALAFSLDGGTAARVEPLRSVWRFDGVIRYRRALRLSESDGGAARLALGMVTMAALSTLSRLKHETRPRATDEPTRPLGPRMPGMQGRFDETGALEVLDLTNPTYDCTVRLLEAD